MSIDWSSPYYTTVGIARDLSGVSEKSLRLWMSDGSVRSLRPRQHGIKVPILISLSDVLKRIRDSGRCNQAYMEETLEALKCVEVYVPGESGLKEHYPYRSKASDILGLPRSKRRTGWS